MMTGSLESVLSGPMGPAVIAMLVPIVALVGHREVGPLDFEAIQAGIRRAREAGLEGAPMGETLVVHHRAPLLAYYAGNLTVARAVIGEGRRCTEDRPWIEFLSPVTQRHVIGERGRWLVGAELMALFGRVFEGRRLRGARRRRGRR